jgi:hypothetical protein
MKISELLNGYPEGTVDFQPINVSVDTIKEKTMKKIQAAQRPVLSKKRRVFSAIAVAAALVVLLTGVAFATGIIKYDDTHGFYTTVFSGKSHEGLVEFYEPDDPLSMYDGQVKSSLPGEERVPVDEEKADELIGDKITAETGVIVFNGYTLTVEANLYDAATGCGVLYLVLENPNGISGIETKANGLMYFSYNKGTQIVVDAGERLYIDAESSTDTKLYMSAYYINGFNRKETSVQLIEMEIDERGRSVSDKRSEVVTVTLGGESLTSVTTQNGAITVTPIGIRIDGFAIGYTSSDFILEYSLKYKDGTTYVLRADFVDNTTYGLNSVQVGDYTTVLTNTFNRLVDTAQVAAVVIDGVEYPIA